MMRSVGVQRSRSLSRDRSIPSRSADANVDSAVAFDRIWLRSALPIIDDRFMLNGGRQSIELEGAAIGIFGCVAGIAGN